MRVGELRRHAQALGFTPRDQVRWLSPGQLRRTAVIVGLSSVFADYTDRREAQAALPAPPLAVQPDADELWMDFVADLGDGFDPTYTVATLLAQPHLRVDGPDGAAAAPPLELPRADLLVLGGDEVYPTPSAAAYEDRTKGPYRAALAEVPAGAPRPVLLALPGNHDWYDGLTAFLRVFAQRRHVGAWRTVQTRSYFAVRLPRRWWLVGIDTQLNAYVDDPQVRYFREHLTRHLQPGDGVVVVCPSPGWVAAGGRDPEAFASLEWFERELVAHRTDDTTGERHPTGAQVRLWLSGDLHHYARYAEEGGVTSAGRQLVTCGLGGSYLADTHRLPERLQLPPAASRAAGRTPPARYRLASRWPSVESSRRLVRGLVTPTARGLPFRNPGAWRLAGGLQAALLLALAFVLGVGSARTPVGVLRLATVGDVLALGAQALAWASVAAVLWTAEPLVRRRRPRPPSEFAWAAAAQVLVALAALTVAVSVPWPSAWPPWLVLGLAVLGAWVGAGLLSCFVFAAYVLASRRPDVQGWQSSAQAVEEGKGFLRLHFAPDGRVTVHPVVVDEVCHDWSLEPAPAPGGVHRVRPVPAGGLPRAHLAEPPFVVERSARVSPAGSTSPAP